MAFTSIPDSIIQVGKAVTKLLWQYTKDNFDDLDSRTASLETSQSRIKVFDTTFYNSTPASILTNIEYFQAQTNFTIVEAVIKVFEVSTGAYTGSFEVDIQKSTTGLDFTGSNSIFDTRPSVSFPASDFAESSNASINSTIGNVSTGDILRLDITELPSDDILSRFVIEVYGES